MRRAVQGLEGWLSGELGEPVRVDSAQRLGGAAAREIWKVAVTNAHDGKPLRLLRLVRGEVSPGSESGLSPAGEFAVLRAAHEAGVLVPRPLFICDDSGPMGVPFFVTEFVRATGNAGSADRDSGSEIEMFPSWRTSPGGYPGAPAFGRGLPGSDIAAQWGREIAKLHRITPRHTHLRAMNEIPGAEHFAWIDHYRKRLDALGDPQPVLEWVMRQLERNAPEGVETVLCHGAAGDPGCVVDDGKLLVVLDWQWSRWGDPHGDIGEVFAACRRRLCAQPDSAADAAKRAFLEAYRAHSRFDVDEDVVRFWEVMATLRRAVAALEQGHRFVSGGEVSIELALQSRRVAEMEIDLLAETDRLAMARSNA